MNGRYCGTNVHNWRQIMHVPMLFYNNCITRVDFTQRNIQEFIYYYPRGDYGPYVVAACCVCLPLPHSANVESGGWAEARSERCQLECVWSGFGKNIRRMILITESAAASMRVVTSLTYQTTTTSVVCRRRRGSKSRKWTRVILSSDCRVNDVEPHPCGITPSNSSPFGDIGIELQLLLSNEWLSPYQLLLHFRWIPKNKRGRFPKSIANCYSPGATTAVVASTIDWRRRANVQYRLRYHYGP